MYLASGFILGISPNHDELIGIRKRQRPEQHGIDDTKDGAVRSDAEGKREDGDDGEAGCLEQHPEGVFKVSDHNK